MLPEVLRRAIFWASDAVFGPWTIALLFATGIFLTFRLRFVQVVRFGDAVRAMAPAGDSTTAGALSPFQSFMTALGATIGTGNIVFGAIGKVDLVWAWGDLMNGLQIFPNLVGVIGLSGIAAATLRGTGPSAAQGAPEIVRS